MTRIELPATFDATTVRGVYDKLRVLLEQGDDVTIDGAKVEAIDTAGAQLLAAFALSGRRVHLQVSKPLEDFLQATAIAVVVVPEH